MGSFCVVCSLHCFSSSVVCRLVLFHFGVFPRCLHFLVHSVVAKLVVSKNCPKLVHKYLQNYSKLNITKNWNCVKKLPEIIFVTKNHNHFEVEGTRWKKITVKVWGKTNFYIDPRLNQDLITFILWSRMIPMLPIQKPPRLSGCFFKFCKYLTKI